MTFEPDVRHFLWVEIAASCLRQGIDVTPQLIIENAPLEIKKKITEGKVCKIVTNFEKKKGRCPQKDKNKNWIFNLEFLKEWCENIEIKSWFDEELKKTLGFGERSQREWLRGKVFEEANKGQKWAIELLFENTGMSIIEEEGISEDDTEDEKNEKRKEIWLRKLGQKAMSAKGTFANMIAYGNQMGWEITNKEDKFLQDYYGGLDLVGKIAEFRDKLEELEKENKGLRDEKRNEENESTRGSKKDELEEISKEIDG